MSTRPSSTSQSRWRRFTSRLLVGLGAFALSLGLAELVARAFLPAPILEQGQFLPYVHMLHENPRLRYVLRPNARATIQYPATRNTDGFAVEYAINSLGWRDRERTRQKSPGTVRVAFLGDSITLGIGVQCEQNFAALLEGMWQRRHLDCKIEALNCGVYGYDTKQELAAYDASVMAMQPDLVVLVFFVNDVEPVQFDEATAPTAYRWIRNLGLSESGTGSWSRPLSKLIPAARRYSHLARVASALSFNALRTRALEAGMRRNFKPASPGWRKFQAALAKLQERTRANGAQLQVAIHPYLRALNASYGWESEELRVLELCRKLGITCHEFHARYPKTDKRRWFVHPFDAHPNAAAHAIFAEFLDGTLGSEIASLCARSGE